MPYFNPTSTLQLFYTLHGSESNPPLLVVHGWCCNSHDWDFHIASLAQTYRVIALDLRGHGHSSAPTDINYRKQDHMSDVIALLHHLGYEKDVRAVGHSMGGFVVSALSVTKPELFKAFVLVDPHYFASEAMSKKVIEAYEAAAGDVTAVNLKFWPSLIGANHPEWMKTWYLRRVEETPVHVIRGAVEGSMSDQLGMTMDEHLELRKRTKLPRLAIYRDEEGAQKERVLGSKELDEVVVIEGVGHWLHHAKSDQFNEILSTWLKKVEEA